MKTGIKTTELKAMIVDKQLDDKFQKLYMDTVDLKNQRERYINAIETFENLYGIKEVEIYSAPGRTEIGGNHTDHQNGKVLAASIDLDAIAIVAKTEDSVSRIQSEGYQPFAIDVSDLEPCQDEIGKTQAIVRGVANGMVTRGYQVGGFEAYITSDVLSGSGLSSSAAYEVLIGTIFSGLYNENKLDPITIAQIGQEAERIYFGKPCGLMDQMACSVGGAVYIDFAEEEHPAVRKVDVDFNGDGHCLCIVDTKGSHANLTDEYAAVPAEMKKVAAYFGKELLCQVPRTDFYLNIANIREMMGDRAVLRALHWYEENLRVEEQVEALEKGDFERFKSAVKESGNSSFKYLQNVYSGKNVQEQNLSIALGISDSVLKGNGISRVHGGGFAGTIQAFVPDALVSSYKNIMERTFGQGSCYILHIRPEGGVKII